MKNIETANKIHLSKLIDKLKQGDFVIPDFQREFAWEPWDIVDLLKSIFLDYYIGTLLLWKTSKENVEILKCEGIYGTEEATNPQHIVLDGQQRLTAIYYSVFAPDKVFPRRKNKCFFFVKIDRLLEEDFDDETFFYSWESNSVKELIADKTKQFEQKIMPLTQLQDTWGIMDWVRGYAEYSSKKTGNAELFKKEEKKLEEFFKDLLNNYYISSIELDRDVEVSKVCEIFTKINSKGVPLNIFDLLNAILRPHDIFLKELWRNSVDTLEYIDSSRMRTYVIQVMSILKQNYCSARYLYFLVPDVKKKIKRPDGTIEEIVLIEQSEDFIKVWNMAVSALQEAIKLMKNPRDYGAIAPKFVPYASILPIFAAINYFVRENNLQGRANINKKIKQWYWASIFTQNYSSAVESQSAKDFVDLKEWFEDDQKKPGILDEFSKEYLSLDLKSEIRQGTAIYNAIFNFLIIEGASDWRSFQLPEYSELDDHHIVPASWGRNIVGSDINSILNKTPLTPETNRFIIRDRMPCDYIQNMIDENGIENVKKVMKSHLISEEALSILMRKDFSKEDFYEFIEARRQAIVKKLGEVFDKNDN